MIDLQYLDFWLYSVFETFKISVFQFSTYHFSFVDFDLSYDLFLPSPPDARRC